MATDPKDAEMEASTESESTSRRESMDVDKDESKGHKELERQDAPSAHEDGKERQVDGKLGRSKVDRAKSCPFLIRLFVRSVPEQKEISVDELERNGLPSTGEVFLHTWKDASLRELASLLPQELSQNPNARFHFRHLTCMSSRPLRYRATTLGTVSNYKSTPDDSRTLDSMRFVIGDGILVTISTSSDFRPDRGTDRMDRKSFASDRMDDRRDRGSASEAWGGRVHADRLARFGGSDVSFSRRGSDRSDRGIDRRGSERGYERRGSEARGFHPYARPSTAGRDGHDRRDRQDSYARRGSRAD
ncbi:Sin3 associated polypeptide p18-domain-containing protein [Gaertneriomyces semiglobifer]|nr:Sin3 associated polypeptide p18-domain-containing protein [Gaertneriomyces semiglobifer]